MLTSHDSEMLVIPKDAAVQWAIIKPEFKPPSFTKKAGSSLRAEIRKVNDISIHIVYVSSWSMQCMYA